MDKQELKMKPPCKDCGNNRRKLYHHNSGNLLCQSCLVVRAREGRRDFRTRKKS